MKHLFTVFVLLPFFCFAQSVPRLRNAQHTCSLYGDSLTIFQEAEFNSIVDWYADADTLTFSGKMIFLDIYYQPETTGGTWPYPSTTRDTFAIDRLSTGSHTLIVNSYEYGDSVDQNNVGYTFYTLRDSDTSHFQVLSDGGYLFEEPPLSFYPNPASDYFNVKGLKPGEGTLAVSIMDLQGREIRRSTVSYENPKVAIGDLPNGNYIFQFEKETAVTKHLFLVK